MNRQKKNRQGWIARFLRAKKKRKPQRQGRSLVIEGLESRQMLSSMPWLPAEVTTIPSGEYSASVPIAEYAQVSNGVKIGNHAGFQQLEKFRDILLGVPATDFAIPEQPVGFPGASDGPVLDFGLGGGDDDSRLGGFPDPNDFPGLENGGKSRTDGLPANAPPSGWGFGGIAGLDVNGPAKVFKSDEGTVTKTWVTRNEDGGVVTHSQSRSPNGDSYNSETTEDELGTYRTTIAKTADGTVVLSRFSMGRDGRGGAESFRRDPDGTIWRTGGSVRTGKDGFLDVTWGSRSNATGSQHVPRWLRDIGGNPGDDGTTESQQALANWLWSQHKLGRHSPGGSGPRIPTLVNPGDPDYEGAYADYPSIAAGFTDSIAVNPDPNSASSGGSAPSARAWRTMVGDLFNGPGPGFNPGPRP